MTEHSGGQGPAGASTVSRRTSRRCSGAVVSAAFAAAGAADRRRSRIGSTGRRKSVSLCRFSVQAASERRQSQILAEADAAAAVDDNVTDVESQLPFPDYPAKAFFFLDQTSVIRHWCLKAISWPYPCCFFLRDALQASTAIITLSCCHTSELCRNG